MHGEQYPLYSAVIVTYRRPESLSIVLESLRSQTAAPSLTVVVDNDQAESARETVSVAQPGWPGVLSYVPAGSNLGPAGGWALAVQEAGSRHDLRGDWVMVLDDDDPLSSPALAGHLLGQPFLKDLRVAGVGLRGARLDRRRARLRRVEPPEPDAAAVDYLAGGGAPTYRWTVIDSLGFFVSELFFGFEDLEWGLRLRQAGYELRVAPKPSIHVVADTATTRLPWREYYKTRSLVWILRERSGRWPAHLAASRSLAGGLLISIRQRSPELFIARLYGLVDAYSGVLGIRRFDPTSNPPKPATVSSSEPKGPA